MMLFDPEFWDRRLTGRGMVPLSQPTDVKNKATPAKPSARTRIVIPLASKPADYVPGSGPPLQPISLLPPGDSTAHIIERVLLPSPGPAPNGRPLPKRMAYLIGWRDLPAASMLVPAMQVLDYVSPRTLEDFEERLEQELDDEKGRLEEEIKSDLVAPQKKKKKRGRPPAHSQIESAVVAEPETVAQAKSRHKKGVMSLSTPQKSRLEEFQWLSDEEGSPSRQIAEEHFQSLPGYLADEDEVTEDTDGPLPNQHLHVMHNASQPNPIPLNLKQPSAPSPRPFSSPVRARTTPEYSSGVQTPAKCSLPPSTSPLNKSNQSSQSRPGPAASSFAPAGQGERQFPPNVISEEDKTDQSIPAEAKPKKSRKRPRSEDGSASNEVQSDKDWVVERIEDVEYYEVDGRGLVRYFRVSWEGDWPPDQKRTWEPEENIPASLVRNFFKTSKSKRRTLSKLGTIKQGNRGGPSSSSKQGVSKQSAHKQGSSSSLKQTKLSWPAVRRKYSSASEAFAGDQDSLEMMDEGYDGEEDELNGGGQDEFFVVTEGGDNELHGQSLWPTTGTLSTALGVFRGFHS
ncbi:hypothetical protein TARUN_9493 [Trichoderma arundinaceum]|uniref:Chromo domain-containing protein n=1 Tax=Trichoderma arundinaceum TaxID=490622 RepID=A0A395N9G0_TRIAR|nr:hypothetical protein TARUN_9493 [Trichoderma arundinaceum]